MQHCVAITLLQLKWEQNKSSSTFELWRKIRQWNRPLYWFTYPWNSSSYPCCRPWRMLLLMEAGTCCIYLWTVSNTRRCQPCVLKSRNILPYFLRELLTGVSCTSWPVCNLDRELSYGRSPLIRVHTWCLGKQREWYKLLSLSLSLCVFETKTLDAKKNKSTHCLKNHIPMIIRQTVNIHKWVNRLVKNTERMYMEAWLLLS